MKTTALANLTGVTKGTIHRWCSTYRDFLSPTATPAKDKTRIFTKLDVGVLYYVSTMRDSGVSETEILSRLEEMQSDHWANLPNLPVEYQSEEETIPVEVAVSKASQLAQLAVLQTELAHREGELIEAREKVEELSTELEQVTGERDEEKQARHELEIQLAEAKGRVTGLEAEIRGFGLAYGFGRERPVNVGFIVVAALVVGAIVVMVAVLLTALIL